MVQGANVVQEVRVVVQGVKVVAAEPRFHVDDLHTGASEVS